MTNEEREERINKLEERISKLQARLSMVRNARQCKECDNCTILKNGALCSLPSWPIEPSVIDPESYEDCEFFWERNRDDSKSNQEEQAKEG